MNPAPLARILVVDDDAAQMRAVRDTLRDHGYETVGFTAGDEALAALRETGFDLLLTDLMMPGMDGVALLTAALRMDPQLVGILMTGKGTIETAVDAMKAGALDYVLKPIKLRSLLPAVARAVGTRQLRLENFELRNTVAIHELNQAIAHTLDVQVLLDKIADAALAQFEADEASIMLPSEDGGSFLIAAARGEGREALIGARVPIGDGIAGWVAARREPLVLEGEVMDERFAPLHPRAAIKSALCMPMITRGKLVGVLNINCTRARRAFTLGQIKVLSIFTNAAAAGIEAARLHEEQRRTDARYREVLDMAAEGIISIDEDQRIAVFNAGAENVFGYSPGEVLGKPLDILLPPEKVEVHRRNVRAFGKDPDQSRVMAGRAQLFGRRKDGTLFNAEVGISKRSESGNMLYTAVVRDVTQRVQQEEKIARLSRIQAVLSGINSAIVRIRNREDLFREACRIAVEGGKFRMAWIGLAEPDLGRVRPVSWMGAVDGYLDEVGQALEGTAIDQGAGGRALRERHPVVFNDIEKDAGVAFRKEALARGYRSLAVLPLLLRDAAVGVIALYAWEPGSFDQEEMKLLTELAGDISFALEVMEKEEQLVYIAHHDVMTGLPNRALFSERLDQRVRAAHHDRKLFAVVMLDLERFRNINETLGRHVGDAVLRGVAQRLGEAIGETEVLANVGADHFAIATRRIDDAAEIARIVEHVFAATVSRPLDAGGTTLHLAARAGIAVYPADGADGEGLYRNAEAALREAKRTGQKYQFYAPQMNASVAQALHLENRMRGALERDEFVLHYQPKVELDTGRIVGLEALIRWQDPETGLVPPAHFIPLLEETGLILQAGRWAMQEAARTAAALRAKGLPPVRIAVNVSPIQLRQKDFVASVEAAIAAAGGAPHGLDLEITESVIMHDIDANVRVLSQVRGMGVELAIDDFGTGYSSLAYIGRLPVSVIKIDRAFIRNLDSDAESKPIVRTIISLTHALGRKVVAEGVETEGQARLLRQLRCDQYQGYLFSKPLPAEEIERLLLSHASKEK